jgi:hypothetical protein
MIPFTSHQPLTTAVFPALKCPHCNSMDLKKVSLIHEAAVYESRGSLRGTILGTTDGLLFGRFRGTRQSLLSKRIDPPKKMPYAAPAILWLLGFFILMAFDGRGKLSGLMGMISSGYILATPVYFLVALFHNFLVRPKKQRGWKRKSMCQRCGALIEGLTVTTGQANLRSTQPQQKCAGER